nr:MAG TPA: hypothetical protein [Bacteriophage sp.]DAX66615.1 MAG TPA: hypothetical protein [Bacteriophage sp.]
MTDNKKELVVTAFQEYYDLAREVINSLELWDRSENLRGRKLDVAIMLMNLDNKLVETEIDKTEKVEEKEEKPTTKKK